MELDPNRRDWPIVHADDATPERLRAWQRVIKRHIHNSALNRQRRRKLYVTVRLLNRHNLFALANVLVRRGEVPKEPLLAAALLIFPSQPGGDYFDWNP